jgi:hypothetical protein
LISYDIDGVLAELPPKRNKLFSKQTANEIKQYDQIRLKWYEHAKPLLFPKEKFIAISARSNDSTTMRITQQWLSNYHKKYLCGVYLLDIEKTYDNVANFKSKIIQTHNITKHIEDNKQVLKRMNKILDTVNLYFWEKGMDEPVLYN